MDRADRLRVEAGGFTLVWGNASAWKRDLRDESLHGHLAAPISERFLRALALLVPARRSDDRRR
jgi:hypothetical protein